MSPNLLVEAILRAGSTSAATPRGPRSPAANPARTFGRIWRLADTPRTHPGGGEVSMEVLYGRRRCGGPNGELSQYERDLGMLRVPPWASRRTTREAEIAELASTGLTSTQIGHHLFLSVRTVDTHLGRIYRKLEVSTRTALAHLVVNPRHQQSAVQPVPD